MGLFEKKSLFGKLKERIADAILVRPNIDDELFDELEEILIMSDIGVDTTLEIVEKLREVVKEKYITASSKVKSELETIMAEIMDRSDENVLKSGRPLVILMIGINGGGKTTSIAKLAHRLKNQGNSILLGAGDTFRAAATEQLSIWAERVGVPIVKHGEGADPAAVLFDAIASAKARGTDVLIFDTAGRLQNKRNLMMELEKINKVIDREWVDVERETLLVLDATTGKNAVSQVEEFGNIADLTGVILTKMDGTAKGGIALTITNEFNLPVKFIGVGEKMEDLKPFDAKDFIGGIFNE